MVVSQRQQQQHCSSWSAGSVVPPLGIPLRCVPLLSADSDALPRTARAALSHSWSTALCTCCAQPIWARDASWYSEFTVIAETVKYLKGLLFFFFFLINDQCIPELRICKQSFRFKSVHHGTLTLLLLLQWTDTITSAVIFGMYLETH